MDNLNIESQENIELIPKFTIKLVSDKKNDINIEMNINSENIIIQAVYAKNKIIILLKSNLL